MTKINQTVLMSGADYFAVEELNPYSHKDDQPDKAVAAMEFASIKSALEDSGVTVVRIDAPEGCQDGIYTAWTYPKEAPSLHRLFSSGWQALKKSDPSHRKPL